MIKSSIKWQGISSNTLKIIAAVSMLIDHIGVILLPHVAILRILGRLAFPIFAFMIAEGCAKTKNRLRYFLSVFLLGAACQVVYCLYEDTLYLGILITFSLSILLIYALQTLKNVLFDDAGHRGRQLAAGLVFLLLLAGVYVLNLYLVIDYGFWGCLLPVLASVFRQPDANAPRCFEKLDRPGVHVLLFGAGLVILSCVRGGVQPYSLCAVPLLTLYSGTRGAWSMKWFFYIFYPAHLAVLELIAMLLTLGA